MKRTAAIFVAIVLPLASTAYALYAVKDTAAANHDIRDFHARILATEDPESSGMATSWVSGYHHTTRTGGFSSIQIASENVRSHQHPT